MAALHYRRTQTNTREHDRVEDVTAVLAGIRQCLRTIRELSVFRAHIKGMGGSLKCPHYRRTFIHRGFLLRSTMNS